jgi:hypothetical protein
MDPDPDPGGPKTHGSGGFGSGSATLEEMSEPLMIFLTTGPQRVNLGVIIYATGYFLFIQYSIIFYSTVAFVLPHSKTSANTPPPRPLFESVHPSSLVIHIRYLSKFSLDLMQYCQYCTNDIFTYEVQKNPSQNRFFCGNLIF